MDRRWVPLDDGVVDLVTGFVTRETGTTTLTPTERGVLAALAAADGEVVPREQLQVRVLGQAADAPTRLLDVLVSRIRQKIERDPKQPSHLFTLWSVGHQLIPARTIHGPSNLPPARDPSFGRDRLIVEVISALSGGPVALVGLSGIGKSRLAAAVAHALSETTAPGGAWQVDAAGARDGDDLATRILTVLGLPIPDRVGPLLHLRTHLSRRAPSVFVLDDADEVLNGLTLPTTLLATVQSPPPPPWRAVEVPGLSGRAAIALLQARVVATGADPLPPEVAGPLVDALDGWPLAIELAARRLQTMSPSRLLQDLVRSLSDPRRVGRHQSLSAALASAWGALSDCEQVTAVHAAVYRGPVPIGALPRPEDLDRLVAAHLATTDRDGVRLWNAVRAFALAALPDRRGEALAAHAAFWTGWARDRVRSAAAALEGRRDDLVAALPHAADPVPLVLVLDTLDQRRGRFADTEARLRTVRGPAAVETALAFAIGRQGRWRESEPIAAAAFADRSAPVADRVEAGCALTAAISFERRSLDALAAAEAALALAGDDEHLVALARNATVTATMRARRFDLALPFAEACVQAAERTGRADLIGKALHNLASVVGFLGRHEEADDRRREALPHLEGDLRATAIVHQNLAFGALTFGRPEEAVALAEDAIGVHRDAGAVDHLGIASAVASVALATLDRAAEGLAVIEAAEALLDGDERGLCQLGSLRAALLALAGRSADGRRTWAALRFLPESLGLDPATAEALVGAWTGGSAAPELGPRLLADVFTIRWLHGHLLALRATGRCW